MVYTAIAMFVRYLDKAYKATGGFGTDNPISLRPKFGTIGAAGAATPSVAIFVSMLSTAFMAHFNAPKVRRLSNFSILYCFQNESNTWSTQIKNKNCSFVFYYVTQTQSKIMIKKIDAQIEVNASELISASNPPMK